MSEKMCHCGRPLHYTSPQVQTMIEELIETHGEDMVVSVRGRSWSVPRHYIALHGLKAKEIHLLGFTEV